MTENIELLQIKDRLVDVLLKSSTGNQVGVGVNSKEDMIRVYLRQKSDKGIQHVQNLIGGNMADGYSIEYVPIGHVVSLFNPTTVYVNPLSYHRPLYGGDSIGASCVGAGTNGGLVYDAVTKERFLLSNNHVFACSSFYNNMKANIGDTIFAPGCIDVGCTYPIGTLHKFIPYNSTKNYIDVALVKPNSDMDISDEINGIGIPTGWKRPEQNMQLIKSGRCFTKDTLLITTRGPKNIDEVMVGDSIFSYNEDINQIKKENITNIFKQGVREVYTIKTLNKEVTVTDNHPFLVATRYDIKKQSTVQRKGNNNCITVYNRYINTFEWKLEWKETRYLEKNDIIVSTNKIIDSSQSIGSKFARLIGYWIGDGSAHYLQGTGGNVSLYSANEKEAMYYANILEETFGKKCKINKRRNHYIVHLYSASTAKKFIALCDGKKLNKYIPEIIWSLPIEERVQFIEGYTDADGYRYNHYNGNKTRVYSYCSPNKKLINEVKYLCDISGVRATKVSTRYRTGGYKKGNVYEFKAYPDYKKTQSFAWTKKYGSYVNLNKLKISEELELDKIISITKKEAEETYDIEVSNSHNFIGNGIIMHNTSGVTQGTINDVWATLEVDYNGTIILMSDTIVSTKTGDPGDSGSLALSPVDNKVLGLLFAGSSTITCYNRIENVMAGLNILITPNDIMPAATGNLGIDVTSQVSEFGSVALGVAAISLASKYVVDEVSKRIYTQNT